MAELSDDDPAVVAAVAAIRQGDDVPLRGDRLTPVAPERPRDRPTARRRRDRPRRPGPGPGHTETPLRPAASPDYLLAFWSDIDAVADRCRSTLLDVTRRSAG